MLRLLRKQYLVLISNSALLKQTSNRSQGLSGRVGGCWLTGVWLSSRKNGSWACVQSTTFYLLTLYLSVYLCHSHHLGANGLSFFATQSTWQKRRPVKDLGFYVLYLYTTIMRLVWLLSSTSENHRDMFWLANQLWLEAEGQVLKSSCPRSNHALGGKERGRGRPHNFSSMNIMKVWIGLAILKFVCFWRQTLSSWWRLWKFTCYKTEWLLCLWVAASRTQDTENNFFKNWRLDLWDCIWH